MTLGIVGICEMQKCGVCNSHFPESEWSNKKAESVTPPMFLEKPSWSSEDFWVLSICYNQNLATLSFVAAPSISQVLTRPSVDKLPAIQAVQEGLVVLCVLFTA